MSLFPDDNEGEAPSTSPTLDVQSDGAEGAQDNGSQSSGENGVTEDDSVLSIVRDVVKDGQAADSPTEGAEKGQKPGEAQAQPKDDYSDVPFSKHPRFQELIKEKNDLKVDATRYRNVQRFLDDSGLTGEETRDGLNIMALMKTNPVEAWKEMKPIVQNLLVAAGEIVSDELKQRVASGELTEAAALEISRANAVNKSLSFTAQFKEHRGKQTAEQKENSDRMSSIVDWEKDRRKKDPNFEAKLPALQREISYLQRSEGVPRTPASALDQINRAYKAINPATTAAPGKAVPVRPGTTAQRTQQPRPATAPRLSSSSAQPSGNAQAAGDSLLDIVKRNRRGT